MDKRLLITGGTGFVGQLLCPELVSRGYSLSVLSRQDADSVRAVCGRVETVNDLRNLEGHSGFDAIINLAGEGIADKRWSEARKRELMASRIGLTKTLVTVAKTWNKAPSVLVSGSAVGFYGDQGDREVDENTQPLDEFTHKMCRDWENEARALESVGTRVCLSRTGLVVGAGGGFLQRMLLPFKLGLGGRIGNGRQYMPWVHREDVVAAIVWMLENERAQGAYNVVSPKPVSNREFTRTLAKTLSRPAIFPVPAPLLKVAMGEMARLLLTGQKALPKRLMDEGFDFKYPDLEPALQNATRF